MFESGFQSAGFQVLGFLFISVFFIGKSLGLFL